MMYAWAWHANDPTKGYISTIVKPIFNIIRGIRCIIYPGIALVGPGLQAPMFHFQRYANVCAPFIIIVKVINDYGSFGTDTTVDL